MKTWLVHEIPHGAPTKGYIQNPTLNVTTELNFNSPWGKGSKCKTFQNPTTYNHEKNQN
jgi:hypothetical protein